MAGIVVGLLILFFLGLFSSHKDEEHSGDEYILYLEKWANEQGRNEEGEGDREDEKEEGWGEEELNE